MNFSAYHHLKNSISHSAQLWLKERVGLALLLGLAVVPVMSPRIFGTSASAAVAQAQQGFEGGYIKVVNQTRQPYWLCGTGWNFALLKIE